MKPTNDIHAIFKQLRVDASAELDEKVHGAISDALTQSNKEKPAVHEPNVWRVIMKSRIAQLTAAAAVVVAVLIGINHFGGAIDGAGIAFADVQAQIRFFRPYSCLFTWEYEGKQPSSHRLMRLSLARRREVFPDGSIRIFDLSQTPNKSLQLQPDRKSAVEITVPGTGPRSDPDILSILANMQGGIAEDLGMKEIDGRLAQGFHRPDEINDFTVWADPETGLPIHIEVVQPKYSRRLVMSDFEFDVNFDESLFSTTAPEGYDVETMTAKGGIPTEQDLIEGLRAIAVFLGGEFPPVLDWIDLGRVLRKHIDLNQLSPSEDEITTLSDKARDTTRFVSIMKMEKRDIHYVGQGVKLGDADTPILWYRPQDSETYRVIYGDLHVVDMDAEMLPSHDDTTVTTETKYKPQAVKRVPFRPYSCKHILQDENKPERISRVMYLTLSRRRQVEADGSIFVCDMSEKTVRILELYPDKKEAIETIALNRGPTRDPDYLNIIANLQDGSEEDLGTKEINGRMAKGFHSPSNRNDFTVWLDVETGLPVRIEMRQPRIKRTIIMEDFEFDVDFDESLFSPTAPEGYQVKKVER